MNVSRIVNPGTIYKVERGKKASKSGQFTYNCTVHCATFSFNAWVEAELLGEMMQTAGAQTPKAL